MSASNGDNPSGLEATKPVDASTSIESGGGLGLLSGNTHQASDARMIGRAIRERWAIPESLLRALPLEVVKILRDSTTTRREKLRAVELIRRMQADNQAADVECDKLTRLETGQATENVSIILKPITLGTALSPASLGAHAGNGHATNGHSGNGNGNGHSNGNGSH